MADYDSQLPVRSKQDADERVQVKLMDYTTPEGADAQLEITEKSASVKPFGKDSDGNKVQQLVSQEGHALTNGDYDATNNKRPSSQGMILSDRDASPSESTMNKRPTAVSGDNDKVAVDVAISDSNGNHITESNPLPVYQADNPADEVSDYDQAVDTAKDGSTNHDYTVTALKTLKKLEVKCTASGAAKFDLQIETGVGAGTFTTVATTFISASKQEDTMKYPKSVAAGLIVRVVKTNRDNSTQDVYTQIMGAEV